MRATLVWKLVVALSCLSVPALTLGASAPPGEVPTPYLPSTTVAVEEMLRLADVRATDVVVDLGSGDGRIPITAALAFGARGFGVDIDPKLVDEANENARKAGVADRVRFFERDVFETDVSEATVVTLYLLPGLVNRLQPKLLRELQPGTRIVAHDFPFKDWQADRIVNISKTYYLYVVPAQVGGRWRLEIDHPDGRRGFDIELQQDYQKLKGSARAEAGFLPLFDARIEGARLRFVLADGSRAQHFEGAVRGRLIEGTVRTGIGRNTVEYRWWAERE